ncbi:MAG: right-handed parallel beta-helix repeat-containing protein [bacterium]|nr:right-handed parallel beta-helix repeat-containing protein [bacterium]
MKRLLGFVGILMLGWGNLAFGGTVSVSGTSTVFMTIQAGINACPDGGTVSVAAGTYTGIENKDLFWTGKHITVRSENGSVSTIIDCEGMGRGFCFENTGQNSSDIVEGFTLRNGSTTTNGGGIYCYNSSPTITDCIITGNTAAWYGGGIYGTKSSSPIITNCTITENTANDCGGGIYCQDNSSPTITNCIIATNTALYGGGIHCENNSSPTITGCTITGNIATMEDGGDSKPYHHR